MKSERTQEEIEDAKNLEQYILEAYEEIIAVMKEDESLNMGEFLVTQTTQNPIDPFSSPIIYETKIVNFPKPALDFLIRGVIQYGSHEISTIGNYGIFHSTTKSFQDSSSELKDHRSVAVTISMEAEAHPSEECTKLKFKIKYKRTQEPRI